MGRLLPLKLMMVALLAACVTVNVYFPAAAAEEAADKVIDQVTGRSGGAASQGTAQPESASEPSPPQSFSAPRERTPAQPLAASPAANREAGFASSLLLVAVGRALALVPAAHAQGAPNLDVTSPEIRAITDSMARRFPQLAKLFAAGAIGLTADGLIEIRDQNAIPISERATVKRLVSEDNRDRAALYAEIAKANGHPEWEPQIRQTFARRWVERGAQPGWYYQDASGNWKQK